MKIQSAVGLDASSKRVVGLDSIRFLCAMAVMLWHLYLYPVHFYGERHHGLVKIAIGIYNSLFDGPAGVIVFFLVSGFCIHFPNRTGRPVQLMQFYTRRFLRLTIPALGFVALYWLGHRAFVNITDSVLWSVVCEAVYYLLYPAFRPAAQKIGWIGLTVVSAVGAILAIGTHYSDYLVPNNGYKAAGGYTWLVGLPAWLLGCWLAENYHRFPVVSVSTMWTARAVIYALSVAAILIRFHIHSILTSNGVLLDLFAIPACFWLGLEIQYATVHEPWRVLESAGVWSYSLYLVHTLIGPIFALLGWSFLQQRPSTHLLFLTIVLGLSYLYFHILERPSHQLAIRASRWLKRHEAVNQVAVVGS